MSSSYSSSPSPSSPFKLPLRKYPPAEQENLTQPPTRFVNPHDTSSATSLLKAVLYDPNFHLFELPCGEASLGNYIAVFCLGLASGIGGMMWRRRWGMRLRSAEWVTPNILARRQWVRGVVTSVGDADNFRLYHTPGLGWRWPFKFRTVPTGLKELKDETLHIRIAGVDAPEGAHFGRPGQYYAAESLAWLKNRIEGKTIFCQLIRKDQYGRIVGVPLVPRRFLPLFLGKTYGSPLAFEMLRAGAATTYTQSGAEYGPWGSEAFLQVEEEAKKARRGMWQNGVKIQTPGEYKRQYAAAMGSSPTSSTRPSSSLPETSKTDSAFLRRLKWVMRR